MGNFEDDEQAFLEGADIPQIGVSDEERRKRKEIMERRSGEKLQQEWRQEDRKALQEAEELMGPPVITEPRCDTCQHPHRLWIERQLVKGLSYASVSRSLPPDPETGKKLDPRSISNHYKEHMRVDQAIIRAVLEDEADLLGQNVQEGVKGAFTMRGALDVLIRKAYQDALDGLTTVEPRDLIQMIKLYKEMNEGSGAAAYEEAKTSIRIFRDALINVLIKGDTIDREIGEKLLIEIQAEVLRMRQEDEIENQIERQLLPRGGDAP